jgi:hypothetical protein
MAALVAAISVDEADAPRAGRQAQGRHDRKGSPVMAAPVAAISVGEVDALRTGMAGTRPTMTGRGSPANLPRRLSG